VTVHTFPCFCAFSELNQETGVLSPNCWDDMPQDLSRPELSLTTAYWEGEDLVDPILERDQVPCDEFTAGAVEFMTMPDLEDFPQALVRIEADAVGI